jgi:hypothetical protein
VRHERLGCVVDGLVYGHVDDVRAHAGGDYEVAGALTLEDFSGVFCAVNYTVDWEEMLGDLKRWGEGAVVPLTDIIWR